MIAALLFLTQLLFVLVYLRLARAPPPLARKARSFHRKGIRIA